MVVLTTRISIVISHGTVAVRAVRELNVMVVGEDELLGVPIEEHDGVFMAPGVRVRSSGQPKQIYLTELRVVFFPGILSYPVLESTHKTISLLFEVYGTMDMLR